MNRLRTARRSALVFLAVTFITAAVVWLAWGRDAAVSAAELYNGKLLAVHDRTSPSYNSSCTTCHGAVLTERSLNPAIHTAHVTMRNIVPGESDNQRCRFCHRAVNWQVQTGGSLRKSVDARLCALCHGPGGPAKAFYQRDLSLAMLDGAGYYTLICSGCHGPLTNSQVRGESAREIQKEINEDEGGMGPLGVLTPAEIQAIANALATAGGGD